MKTDQERLDKIEQRLANIERLLAGRIMGEGSPPFRKLPCVHAWHFTDLGHGPMYCCRKCGQGRDSRPLPGRRPMMG